MAAGGREKRGGGGGGGDAGMDGGTGAACEVSGRASPGGVFGALGARCEEARRAPFVLALVEDEEAREGVREARRKVLQEVRSRSGVEADAARDRRHEGGGRGGGPVVGRRGGGGGGGVGAAGGEDEEDPNARMWDGVEEELRPLDEVDAGVLVVGNVGAASGDVRDDPAFSVPALGGQTWRERWAAEDAAAAEMGERAKEGRRRRREEKERERMRRLSAAARESPGEAAVHVVVQPLREVPEELRVGRAPPAGADPADDLDDEACHVCGDGDWSEDNRIIFCDGCDVAVHQHCYGIEAVPDGDEPWFCCACEAGREGGGDGAGDGAGAVGGGGGGGGEKQCGLCPARGGALKRTAEGGWAHLFCSHWIPETFTGDTVRMEPVVGIPSICAERKQLRCQLCTSKRAAASGACIQCSFGNCKFSFHPMCARVAGMHMAWTTRGAGGHGKEVEELVLQAFCPKHSPKAAAASAAAGAFIPLASVGYPAAQAMLRTLNKELELAGKSGSPPGSGGAAGDSPMRVGWKRGRAVADDDSESEESDSNSSSSSDEYESDGSDYAKETAAAPQGRRGRGRREGSARESGRGKGGLRARGAEEGAGEREGVREEEESPPARQFRAGFEEGLHPHVAEALDAQVAGVAEHCAAVASAGDRDLLTGYRNAAKALHDAGKVWDGVERPGLGWEESIYGEGGPEGPWAAEASLPRGDAQPEEEGGLGPAELGALLDSAPPMPMDEVTAELYALQHQLAGVWGANRKALAAVGDRYLRCLPGDLERAEFRRLAADARAKLFREEASKPRARGLKEPKRRRSIQDGGADVAAAAAPRGRPRNVNVPPPPPPNAPEAYAPVDLIGALAGAGPGYEMLNCAVCGDGTMAEGNELLNCDSCDVSVHQKCYGVVRAPQGRWQCQACQDGVAPGRRLQCKLCPVERGAFWRCGNQQFCHPVCVLWTCGATPDHRPTATAFADHLGSIVASLDPATRGRACAVCGLSDGHCMGCGCEGCDAAFHPLCARSAGFYLQERRAPPQRKREASHQGKSPPPGSLAVSGQPEEEDVILPPVRRAFCAAHSREARLEDVARYRQSFSDYKAMTAVRLDLEQFRAILDKVTKRERKKVEVNAELASLLQGRAERAMAPRREASPVPHLPAGGVLSEVVTRRRALSSVAATPPATPTQPKGEMRQTSIFSALKKMGPVRDTSPVLKVAPTFVSANRAGGRPPKMSGTAAMSPMGGASPRTAAAGNRAAGGKPAFSATPTGLSLMKRTPMSRRGSNELKGLGVVLSPRSVSRGRYYSLTPERGNPATRVGGVHKKRGRALSGVKRELYAGSKGSPGRPGSRR